MFRPWDRVNPPFPGPRHETSLVEGLVCVRTTHHNHCSTYGCPVADLGTLLYLA